MPINVDQNWYVDADADQFRLIDFERNFGSNPGF